MEIREESFQDIRFGIVGKVWLFIVPALYIEDYTKSNYKLNIRVWQNSLGDFQHIAETQLLVVENIKREIIVMDLDNSSITEVFKLEEIMEFTPYQLLDLMY